MLSRYMLSKIVGLNITGCLKRQTGVKLNHLRLFSVSSRIEQKPQYEYDSATDTFRPKDQGFTINKQQPGSKHPPLQSFLRRWTRTIFLITGGIVWGAIIFVGLFVDVKENNSFHFPANHDLDEEVRSLVFYNLAHGKNDLARIVSMHENKDDEMEDIHESMHIKHKAFLDAIERVQNDERVIGVLGGHPVQVCGFRVADKIGELIQDFQNLAVDFKSGKTDNLLTFEETNEKIILNSWTAECIIEGRESIGLLRLQFKRKDYHSPWILKDFSFRKLSYSDEIIKLE